MLTRPSPLDLRIDYSIVGHAPDESSARLINERLDAMADWMTGPDETRQSLAWRDWLKIARPDQLPPQFDPNWREWKIGGDRGSGKTTAAAQFIASQTDDSNLRVYLFGLTQKTLRNSLIRFHACYQETMEAKSSSYLLKDGGSIIHRTVDNLDSVTGITGPHKTIVWLEDLLFLPPGVNVGKFHYFLKEMLRARNTRVIWSG